MNLFHAASSGTMDNLTREQRRKNMQHIRSTGSKQEVRLRKTLWHLGLRYRKNSAGLIGKPDIVFTRYKVAVFIDGDFWHGRDMEKIKSQIKSNRDYWIPKIERNISRDKKVNSELNAQGWTILRFWESDVKNNIHECIKQILYCLMEKLEEH